MLPVLDRIPHKDERSRSYGVAPTLGPVRRARTIWAVPPTLPLDQGAEGACVGFGWSAELACDPVRYPVSNLSARYLYRAARTQDRRMGNDFPEGASVLAGAKACRAAGWISEYRWAFGVDQVLDALCAKGPVVLGVDWYDSMYATRPGGLVELAGGVVGGHCILARGYWPAHPQHGDVVVLTNSWGRSWGIDGTGYLRVPDLDRLLRAGGEACIATDVAPRRVTVL